MKIKCAKCKKDAELAPDYSFVECKECGLDMSYGEYVRFIAHNEATYSDILGDYTGSTEGEKAGTCLLYTSPSPRDLSTSRMPSSA